MPDTFSDILYRGSPFLFDFTTQNAANVMLAQVFGSNPLIYDLCVEICKAGIKMNDRHEKALSFIKEAFNLTTTQVDYFMFGYTISASFALACHIIKKHGATVGLERLCPPATDDFIRRLNIYKSRHITACYTLYNYHVDTDIKSCFWVISNFCHNEAFVNDRMYLAGVESARRGFESLHLFFDH